MKVQMHRVVWGSCSNGWRVLVNINDPVFEGSPVEIMKQITDTPIRSFVENVSKELAKGKKEIHPSGETDEEISESFLKSAAGVGVLSIL